MASFHHRWDSGLNVNAWQRIRTSMQGFEHNGDTVLPGLKQDVVHVAVCGSHSILFLRGRGCEEEIERSVFSGHGGFRETSTLGTLALDMSSRSSSMERSIFLATVGLCWICFCPVLLTEILTVDSPGIVDLCEVTAFFFANTAVSELVGTVPACISQEWKALRLSSAHDLWGFKAAERIGGDMIGRKLNSTTTYYTY